MRRAIHMRVCFIHQNMPAQYRHLIGALLRRGDQVLVIGERRALERWGARHANLGSLGYTLPESARPPAQPTLTSGLQLQAARAQAVLGALRQLLAKGLKPDLVVVHPGWGEAMLVRAALPDTPLLVYCEFFYRARGADVGFDPEYPVDDAHLQRLQLRKLPHLLALHDMDAGWSPTQWQREQVPAEYRTRIEVVHEGIDTDAVRPDAQAEAQLGALRLRAGDAVVTFVARNLEPYRGFHTFMRCLPRLQRLAPQAQVVVVGGDEVSYGQRLPPGQTYRQRLVAELGERVDWSRVHFTGPLPYASYLKVLQVSAAHAYLSVPFVLSWSMLEAMAAGAPVVGSDTPPVREVIEDGVNGRLVGFFDHEALADRLAEALAARDATQPLRDAARRTVQQRYDLARVCLPAGLLLLDRVAARA